MSQIKVTKENVWSDEFFEKLEGTKARCRKCGQEIFYYMNAQTFRLHLRGKHKIYIIRMAERKLRDKQTLYWDKIKSICFLCKKPFANRQLFFEHARDSKHSDENILDYEVRVPNIWEHGDKLQEIFKVKCKICENDSSLIALLLPIQLKNHVDKCVVRRNTIGSSERVLPRKTDTMPKIDVTTGNMWRYFKKLENFKAECKVCCSEIISYIVEVAHLSLHLQSKHEENMNNIARRKLGTPRCYYDEKKLECKICGKDVGTNEQFIAHVQHHTEEEVCVYEIINPLEHYKSCDDDFKVICTFCVPRRNKSVYKSLSKLTTHLNIKCGKRNTAMKLLPEIIVNEENILDYYTLDARLFHAQCKHCSKRIDYADTSNIHDHFKEKHERFFDGVLEDEARGKLTAEPHKYFDEKESKCKICKAKIENFSDHINEHTLDDATKYEIEDKVYHYSVKTKNDFGVSCLLCTPRTLDEFETVLPIEKELLQNHLYNCDKRYNTAGSSKRVLPGETDTNV